uniref:Uncharacterized protein n=1 Tax=Glossina palpalis gambiensis TaxID=67801 RepID=A0A1B0APV8_9MUSC
MWESYSTSKSSPLSRDCFLVSSVKANGNYSEFQLYHFIFQTIYYGRVVALRCKACSILSNSNIAAPSPITNPSRFMSKGREAWFGISLKAVIKARILQNPAIDSRSMHDSPLPANIISALPFRIKRIASPMPCEYTLYSSFFLIVTAMWASPK